jgi:dihydrofolate reductase
MRRIVVNTFITLDGIMQSPGGPQEDTTNKFELGGWSVNYWDDIMVKTMGEASQTPYDLLLGRKTYEIFAAYWPFTNDDTGIKFTKANKYVASKTLKNPSLENSVVLDGDVVEQLKKLKASDGIEMQVHGSANFLQTLMKHGLIDEYNVWTFPLVIGKGKRLFSEGTVPLGMELTKHVVSGSGVIIATYVPKGDISVGSFELPEPTEAEKERRKKN